MIVKQKVSHKFHANIKLFAHSASPLVVESRKKIIFFVLSQLSILGNLRLSIF